MKIKTSIGLAFLILFLFSGATGWAQSKKEIVNKGISVITTYKQDLDNGENEPFIDLVEYYNADGELIEYKDYADNGKRIKEWFKYTYDADGNCIEEAEYDSRGRLKERQVTKFEDGLKVLREYYDDKDRLTRIRKYEYEYSK